MTASLPLLRAGLRPVALLLAGGLSLAACTSPDPVAYAGLDSAPRLQPNRGEDAAHVPFRYSGSVSWRNYAQVILEPVQIYRGADAQFGDISEADRQALAAEMQRRFAARLGERFTLAQFPAPGTLRIRLTLTGAATNTPVLGTLSRFDLAGGLYNGVQAVRGREGVLTGSVSYAVEIHDASSNQLLEAFVAKQYPNPYNLGASMGALAAARTGIDKGAEALLEHLR
ncbi:DUF3313 domain-containing protein [Roseomonas sp. GC11]|uniref:DUF3313 domain-containing protein n=1 Tax=Roseomonas sp. GC11 TaxID=2950546 RepID=UPI00210CF84D|nr:DUF3313 domain-containing protein [Roseomonas sp. GC11]MCQ4158811.1 DUF3313 domain-containing protein [Roseomonas sp. GC11]